MNSSKKLLLVACALALAALALSPVAAAESCPKGQVGTPPYCTTPSNRFTLETVKHEGTSAKIRIRLPGPGVVTASGKYLQTTTGTAKSAGKFWFPLKLTSAGVAVLQKKRTLKVRITFVYTPTGGLPLSKRKTIRFKLKG
jgi:hypothetical protein